MFSYEDRLRAVQLYIKLGKRIGLTILQLGDPTKNALRNWYREYERHLQQCLQCVLCAPLSGNAHIQVYRATLIETQLGGDGLCCKTAIRHGGMCAHYVTAIACPNDRHARQSFAGQAHIIGLQTFVQSQMLHLMHHHFTKHMPATDLQAITEGSDALNAPTSSPASI